MRRTTQGICHTVLIVMQIIVASDKELSARQQVYVAAFIAGLQFYIGDRAHKTNPDGTPAECAYHKHEK